MEEKNLEDTKLEDKEFIKLFREKYKEYYKNEWVFEQCSNILLGDFDEQDNYAIKPIIISELKVLPKVILEKDFEGYTAFSIVLQHKLNFEVAIEDLPGDMRKATLILVENYDVGIIYKSKIRTVLAEYTEQNSPAFHDNVRRNFNLIYREEMERTIGLNEYKGSPIETTTQIFDMRSLLTKKLSKREELSKKYVNKMLQELKNSKVGVKILNQFLLTVRANKLNDLEENKYIILKQVLDKIINEELKNKAFSIPELEIIQGVRDEFITESKAAEVEYDKAIEDSAVGIADPSPKKSAEKSPARKGGGGGGGNKGGGGKKSGGGGKGGGGGGGKGGKKDPPKPFEVYKFSKAPKNPSQAEKPTKPAPEKPKTDAPTAEDIKINLDKLTERVSSLSRKVNIDGLQENVGEIKKSAQSQQTEASAYRDENREL